MPTPKKNIIEVKFQTKKWGQVPKAKLIGAKAKANTDSTSFLIDVVWDGRLWYIVPTSLMTVQPPFLYSVHLYWVKY